MSFDVNFAVNNFFVALSGIPITLLITFVSVAIGLPLGFLIALARLHRTPILNQIFTLYLSLLRGVPTIVLIFLVYAAIPLSIKQMAAAWNWNIKVSSINPLWYAFLVFGLKSSATFSEMWRAGLHSVNLRQMEACELVGLSKYDSYTKVIIPQVLATVAPSFCSMLLSLLKDTSLVFIMTIQDITAKSKIAAGLEYKYIEGFVDALIVYVIVCVIIEWLFKHWEIHLNYYRQENLTKD